jgi:sodium/potassium-transporting ATPase subunit alpha
LCTDNDPMETKNLVFFSTHAVEGHAKGVVVAVGANTVMGKMAQLASSMAANKAKSPIVEEMEIFIMHISRRSLLFGISFLALSLALGCSWKDAVTFFTRTAV